MKNLFKFENYNRFNKSTEEEIDNILDKISKNTATSIDYLNLECMSKYDKNLDVFLSEWFDERLYHLDVSMNPEKVFFILPPEGKLYAKATKKNTDVFMDVEILIDILFLEEFRDYLLKKLPKRLEEEQEFNSITEILFKNLNRTYLFGEQIHNNRIKFGKSEEIGDVRDFL